ncbi:hypothetical protein ANN_07795 [Periplaneta americana]|uniref:Uncharacterized protein n=1 Tax=Periplaneta americana TaxID=6978 RepID=A0ABQ8T166_PERAM|nr:hypothetical protein ANN_07795 [Periplaneta americana]
MVGLCEGGNEPPGFLKAVSKYVQRSARYLPRDILTRYRIFVSHTVEKNNGDTGVARSAKAFACRYRVALGREFDSRLS